MSEQTRTAYAVIPAYCEESRVGPVIEAVAHADTISGIVVVDDGSTDKTLASAESVSGDLDIPIEIVSHEHNGGKAAALVTGVEVAKAMGGKALYAVTFVDADLMHISSRETDENRKLGARLLRSNYQSSRPGTLQESLAQAVDDLTRPILAGERHMMIGMAHRTPLIDAFRIKLDWGALGGERSMPVALWDAMLADSASRGLAISGWQIEAVMNTYLRKTRDADGVKLNRSIGKLVMPDVVNVGSRVKAGGIGRGALRMAKIHSQALGAFLKF